jgi:hypothetical protein
LLDRELTEPGDQRLLPQAAGEKLGYRATPPVRNTACTSKVRYSTIARFRPDQSASNRTSLGVDLYLGFRRIPRLHSVTLFNTSQILAAPFPECGLSDLTL